MVLHRDELGPTVLLSDLVQQDELPSPHGTSSDIANLPALHEIVKGFHSLLGRSVVVETMNLEKIDVGSLKTRKRGIDGIEDCLTGETGLVNVVAGVFETGLGDGAETWIVGDESEAFREDDEFFAGDVELCDETISSS